MSSAPSSAARALAQRAHALLGGDAHEAGVRIDAALESRGQREVDAAILLTEISAGHGRRPLGSRRG